MLKRKMRRVLRRAIDWAQEEERQRYNFDDGDVFAYPELNRLLVDVLADPACRPNYTWGLLQAAHLARAVGMDRISAVEFGVAGGRGLIALERAAAAIQRSLAVRIDVYGFDTGHGLPGPESPLDMPNLYREGDYPMDLRELSKNLRRAEVVLGLVEETVPRFLERDPAPVGFASFDLDYYSSTVQAFRLFEGRPDLLLPRVHCYFDDIMALTCGDCVGERLAIHEFNARHDSRKISPIFGLRHSLPRRYAEQIWVDMMFMLHVFDHALYGANDGLIRGRPTDLVPDAAAEGIAEARSTGGAPSGAERPVPQSA